MKPTLSWFLYAFLILSLCSCFVYCENEDVASEPPVSAVTEEDDDGLDSDESEEVKKPPVNDASSGSGIACYRCKSDKDSSCTSQSPSGTATHLDNCTSPNELAHEWLASLNLNNLGLPPINLEPYISKAGKEAEKAGKEAEKAGKDVEKKADLKEVAGCAFFFATSENKATEAVDKGISEVKNLVDDKNSNVKATIQEYVLRDCVKIHIRDEVKEEADRCVTLPGTKEVMTVHACVCTKDKCNEGRESPAMKKLIADSVEEAGNAGSLVQRNFGLEIIFITVLNTFICKFIIAGDSAS